LASKRKPKEVTAEDLERSLAELERREDALSSAVRWPGGKSHWDHLLETDEISDDPPK